MSGTADVPTVEGGQEKYGRHPARCYERTSPRLVSRLLGSESRFVPSRTNPVGSGLGDELDTAALYRSRVVSLRATVNDKSNAHIREQLLALADTYERLASVLEGIHASDVTREQADIAIAAYKLPR